MTGKKKSGKKTGAASFPSGDVSFFESDLSCKERKGSLWLGSCSYELHTKRKKCTYVCNVNATLKGRGESPWKRTVAVFLSAGARASLLARKIKRARALARENLCAAAAVCGREHLPPHIAYGCNHTQLCPGLMAEGRGREETMGGGGRRLSFRGNVESIDRQAGDEFASTRGEKRRRTLASLLPLLCRHLVMTRSDQSLQRLI